MRLDLGSRGNINFNTKTFSLQMQCPLYTQFVKIRIRSRRLDFEVETLLLHISYLSPGVLILCILLLLILTREKCEKSVLPCSSGWSGAGGGPGLWWSGGGPPSHDNIFNDNDDNNNNNNNDNNDDNNKNKTWKKRMNLRYWGIFWS